MSKDDLKKAIRSVKDWPVKGVIFRDITTLMNDPDAMRKACNCFIDRYRDSGIDKIVGIDARGFVFGAVVAYALGVGFVPVRKKGKLPAATVEASYSLEYGSDTLEIHKDALSPGERVVVMDDLIATGGTVKATVDLVNALGGEVVECAFLIELLDLKGREKIPGYDIYRIMAFTETE